MALLQAHPLFSSSLASSTHFPYLHPIKNLTMHLVPKAVQCASATYPALDQVVTRRSANYHPTSWNYDFVQSLRSDYNVKVHHTEMSFLMCFKVFSL